jgi:hypothetical protein
MPNGDANGRSFLAGLGVNLPMIVQIASFAAVIYAQWTVLGNEVSDLGERTEVLASRIDSLSGRVNVSEREQATMQVRYENLRDMVFELRRQSSLRSRTPPVQP